MYVSAALGIFGVLFIIYTLFSLDGFLKTFHTIYSIFKFITLFIIGGFVYLFQRWF
jgi:hypothetical protein